VAAAPAVSYNGEEIGNGKGPPMAIKINSIMPDLHQKRATVFFNDDAAPIDAHVAFPLPQLTGNETMNQVQDMAKKRAKELLQQMLALL
jgi:hypothetical protein